MKPLETESFSESLREQGLRYTPQRSLVFNILLEAEEHLSAEKVWKRASEKDESINLATIYRTLKVLSELGLVKHIHLEEGSECSYYELVEGSEHFHFNCIACGEIIEFESERIFQARDELEARFGVKVIHSRITFEGLCSNCADKSK